MSERNDLQKQGREISAALGVEFSAIGLSNEELRAKVEELEALQAEAAAQAEREAEIAEKAQAVKVEAINANRNEYRGRGLKFDFQVAPGKHLLCKIGRLKSGAEVKPEYVGGRAELDALVEAGAVLRAHWVPRFIYRVVPAHRVEYRTGTLAPGALARPELFAGGQAELDRLVALGAIACEPVT
jgi:hypothetical protein